LLTRNNGQGGSVASVPTLQPHGKKDIQERQIRIGDDGNGIPARSRRRGEKTKNPRGTESLGTPFPSKGWSPHFIKWAYCSKFKWHGDQSTKETAKRFHKVNKIYRPTNQIFGFRVYLFIAGTILWQSEASDHVSVSIWIHIKYPNWWVMKMFLLDRQYV